MKFPEDVHSTIISLPTTLRFIAHDCDPTTGVPDTEQGYQDEYMVNYRMFYFYLYNNFHHFSAAF